MNPDLQIFLQAWTGGAEVSETERQRLLQRLENDAAFRGECVEEIRLLGMIRAAQTPGPRWLEMHDALGLSTAATEDPTTDDLASRVLHFVQAEPQNRVNARWLSWRPLTAAAAGIVFGMFCTSVVFGFGARSVEKMVSLLEESFESGIAPLVKGIPQELNLWCGDDSEIVETYEGVKPAQGKKMVRVLRSDFAGRVSSKPSQHGDLMRVVDVWPFLREANGGEVVMTVSALFNAAPFPEAERYDGVVYLYALGQLGSTEESLLEDSLAHSHGGCRSLDRDPATWQSASARLLLPPGTELVLLKVSFSPVPASGKSQSLLPDYETFAGHFVDDVRTLVNIRKAAPNHSTQVLP
jgi:hypothetical protein